MTGIFDRGSKKWVSIMIPELREGLNQLFKEEIHERPELDEQEVERLNRMLTDAFRTGRQVVIRYWGDDGEHEVAGRISWFEMGTLRLVTDEGKIHIDVDQIIDVSLA